LVSKNADFISRKKLSVMRIKINLD
jgi:hypothetical protein